MTHIKVVSKFLFTSLVLLGAFATQAGILTISGVYQGVTTVELDNLVRLLLIPLLVQD